MSSVQFVLLALAAVLLFWAVGAHNRLMRLRNAIARHFAPLAQQLALRHATLQDQIDSLAPAWPEHADTLAALKAASAQAQAAGAHARARPGAAGAIRSLRLAESILLDTQKRLPSEGEGAAALAGLNGPLSTLEPALQFAQSQFNSAVMEYNLAVQQFPTSLLAGLFGFRVAGVL